MSDAEREQLLGELRGHIDRRLAAMHDDLATCFNAAFQVAADRLNAKLDELQAKLTELLRTPPPAPPSSSSRELN